LELLFERLLPVLDQLGRTYEVVLVEDCSPDQSWKAVESLQRRFFDRVVAIQLMRNSGQHNALMCGFRHARGDLIITMDDDLQNPPEQIPQLLQEIERSDCDLVYGNYAEKQHESYRNLGSLVVNRFYQSVFRTKATVTSFRIIRRPLIDAILDYHRPYVFVDGLMAWNTQRIGTVLVEHHPRQQGTSTYSFSKLLTLATNLFTGFSLTPLQISSGVGIAAVLAGIVLVVGDIGMMLMGWEILISPAGIVACLLVLGGIQLLSLGVLGEYLGRMHLNINGKPQYRERQVLERTNSPDTNSPDTNSPDTVRSQS
jgi:glycosyltransferase involved in cell wall biosynthesis